MVFIICIVNEFIFWLKNFFIDGSISNLSNANSKSSNQYFASFIDIGNFICFLLKSGVAKIEWPGSPKNNLKNFFCSIFIETFGTSKVDEGEIVKTIKKEFKLTPNGIIETLDLRKPIFKKTAAYGHFGREDEDFTWERTDKTESFKKLLK